MISEINYAQKIMVRVIQFTKTIEWTIMESIIGGGGRRGFI